MEVMEIMKKLQEPFMPGDLEWRVQSQGVSNGKPWCMVLTYVTNRAIQNRLDDIFTPFGWKNEYKEWSTRTEKVKGKYGSPDEEKQVYSQLCGISIKFDNEWITKWDGSDNTDIECTKGGLSDSMKRCAVQWGIGRYLYNLESNFAEVSTTKPADTTNWRKASVKDNGKSITYWWKIPELPEWALPEGFKYPKGNKSNKSKKADTGANKGEKTISESQMKLLFIKSKGKSPEHCKSVLKEYGFTKSSEITMDKFDEVIKKIESLPDNK